MNLIFSKYQGTGNDFILVNSKLNPGFNPTSDLIQALCDRKFGIGADGLIIIQEHKTLDFYLDFYNSDGSQSFCGNGSRCGVHFAQRENFFSKNTCEFEAIDGLHFAQINNNTIHLKMGQVEGIQRRDNGFIIDTGSPHYLIESKNIDNENILELGRRIRYSKEFEKEGINVNVFQLQNDRQAKLLTYERGVEDETLSCGTGATACAIALHVLNPQIDSAVIHAKGGNLEVSFKYDSENNVYKEVFLKGMVNLVYNGEMRI